MVNGEPITNYDIEQRSKLTFLTTHKPAIRQQVIDELIDEKVKIKEARNWRRSTASDIDQSYAAMSRADANHAGATDKIAGSSGHPARHAEGPHQGRDGVDQPDPRAIQGEPAGRAKRTSPPPSRSMPTKSSRPRPSNTRCNRCFDRPAGSAPAAIEARQKEAEALRSRVQTCADANAFFKSMQNAAIRESVTKTSADIPAVLREVLDKTPVGHLTPPEVTKQGVEMVALCARKPTTVDTPKEEGDPGQDVCREIPGQVEIVFAGSLAKPR
jgi:peptidyl-prolyl cis-trans isomerase SurA